jgi:glycosyltransferase involved in cell wall biosynthesis
MKNAACAKVKEKSPLNIAYVSPYLAERFGGPVAIVKNIGSILAALGHNVSYWATADKSDREELASIDSAHLYDIGWPRSWYQSKNLVRSLLAGVGSVDIMHISGMWLHPTYAASRIARTNDTPYVLGPAGGLEPWRLKSSRLKQLKKAVYLNLVGKSMMQGAACLHACSVQETEHFRQVGYRGPITVIPNGVDISEFTSGDRCEAEAYWPELKERPIVLFMSRLSREKGLDQLIPAWADLVKSPPYKDTMLVIAGPDDRGYRKAVEAIIDKYNVSPQVCMTGMVRGRRKLALLRRADIFILPSYSENFGIVVAEALACGTPVITTTGTPWQELQAVDAGRWVRPEKTELACALLELLDMSESQRKTMGRRGMTLIKQSYTWDRIVKKFLTVYDRILSGKSIPLHPEPNIE